MPRPNLLRSMESEANLARRIAYERERRGMTYEGLAKRMTDAGCAIQPSAIYKIEKAKPPRRITVDELVGFAVVFGVDVNEMLVPLEAVFNREAREILRRNLAALSALSDAIAGLREIKADFQRFLDQAEDGMVDAFEHQWNAVPIAPLTGNGEESSPVEVAASHLVEAIWSEGSGG